MPSLARDTGMPILLITVGPKHLTATNDTPVLQGKKIFLFDQWEN